MSSQVGFLSHTRVDFSLPNDIIDEDSAKIPDVSIVEASAELLYGLVHQRYVLTRAGLHAMVSELPLVHHRGRNCQLKCS